MMTLNSTTLTRNLGDMRENECQSLFMLAFGYLPTYLEHFEVDGAGLNNLTLRDNNYVLRILSNGKMYAARLYQGQIQPTYIDAVQLVRQLDAIGVEFTDFDDHNAMEELIGPLMAGQTDSKQIRIDGPVFSLRIQTDRPCDSPALDFLLSVLIRWTKAETLQPATQTLAELQIRIEKEFAYMQADGYSVQQLQLQWLREGKELAIASSSVPVTIYATISYTRLQNS